MMLEAFPGVINQYSYDDTGTSPEWGEAAFPGSVTFDEDNMTEELAVANRSDDPNLTEDEF